MRVVIQRVSEAAVKVDDKIVGSIGLGMLVFAGFEDADTGDDLTWISNKIVNLRIFDDDQGIMNKNVKEVGGDILVVSQFTLHASTKKGNRPSYIRAAKAEVAIPMYNQLISTLQKETGKEIATGSFGADMHVSLINLGPVTITIDSKNRE